eukprot:736518-Pyramimonas_sp.AAC.1
MRVRSACTDATFVGRRQRGSLPFARLEEHQAPRPAALSRLLVAHQLLWGCSRRHERVATKRRQSGARHRRGAAGATGGGALPLRRGRGGRLRVPPVGGPAGSAAGDGGELPPAVARVPASGPTLEGAVSCGGAQPGDAR